VTTAVGKFDINDWKEAPCQEFADGRKLTRASVTATFLGDIEGTGSVEWLMPLPRGRHGRDRWSSVLRGNARWPTR
jgi:hypothetical protein